MAGPGTAPIDLDVCVFYDPELNAWSSEGVQLVRPGDLPELDQSIQSGRSGGLSRHFVKDLKGHEALDSLTG